MKVSQLRKVLDAFAESKSGSGGDHQAHALSEFSAALQAHDDLTVKSLVKKFRQQSTGTVHDSR